jgi:hypothetical protein
MVWSMMVLYFKLQGHRAYQTQVPVPGAPEVPGASASARRQQEQEGVPEGLGGGLGPRGAYAPQPLTH